MENKIILKHHFDDYECMFNGIEDLYMEKTNEILPLNFFIVLAGFGSFCYMKTEKNDLKRMIAFGDGRTHKMYEFIAPIVGFEYKFYTKSSFDKIMKIAKEEIDLGYPVVIGALDMYYLPHFNKLYHQEHIPFHYELMTGYNEEKKYINILDCGRSEELTLSYEELEKAWNCSYPGLSKPFTLCKIRFNNCNSKLDIAKEAMKRKIKDFLYPQVSFVGCKGFEKFINDLPKLKNDLTKEDYDKILTNLVMFLGTVPTIPNRLKGIYEEDQVKFYGGFDKVQRVFSAIGNEYNIKEWLDASACMSTGSLVIEKIKEIIVNYLVNEKDETALLPELFTTILRIMKESYHILEKVVND